MLSGAGELPRRLDFSCMCARWVTFVPTVGVLLLCLSLVPWWNSVVGDVCGVSWIDACAVPWSGFRWWWLM